MGIKILFPLETVDELGVYICCSLIFSLLCLLLLLLVVVAVVVVVVVIYVISNNQSMYSYIHETNRVSTVHNVEAILCLQLMVHGKGFVYLH
jgi:hypothetical protein